MFAFGGRVRGDRPGATRRWRSLAFVVLGGVVLVGVLGRSDLVATADAVSNMTPTPLLIALGLSCVAIVNRAGQYRSAQRALGLETSLHSMTKVSAAAYALNKVVKTGGLGGIALFVRHGAHRDQSAGTVIAACLLNSVAGHLVFLGMAGAALVSLAANDSLTRTWSLAAAGVAALIVVCGAAAVIALRQRSIVERWFSRPFELVAKIAARFGFSCPGPPDPEHVDRFYDAAATIRRSPATSLPIIAHAVTAKLLGASVLMASLNAAGAAVGLLPTLLIYALALVAAASTVLPGGFGVVEATMTVLLAGYGVPTSIAIAAILAFRLLDMWFPVAIGLLLAPGLREPVAGPIAAASLSVPEPQADAAAVVAGRLAPPGIAA